MQYTHGRYAIIAFDYFLYSDMVIHMNRKTKRLNKQYKVWLSKRVHTKIDDFTFRAFLNYKQDLKNNSNFELKTNYATSSIYNPINMGYHSGKSRKCKFVR